MIKRITERFTPKQYLGELILGLTALFGLYLIVAWSSYTPLDNSWSTASFQSETINKAGAFGAWIIDALFVFLGYVGHLLPFLIFFVPVFLLKTKAVRSLSITKIVLRSFGFVTLLIGLTIMATLLLSNTNYYLSGGVLGGSLVISLYPTLGKFGCILGGFGLAILGFIFCSGASLIRLIGRFYNWLTMKNDAQQELEQSSESVEELEQIVIRKPLSLVKEDNKLSEEAEKKDENQPFKETETDTNVENPLVQPEKLINIRGLSPSLDMSSQHQKSISEFDEKFDGFKTENLDELPKVTISEPENMSRQSDFMMSWEQGNKQTEENSQSEDDFTLDKPAIPKVTLAPMKQAISLEAESARYPDVVENNRLEDDLSRQFAEQEKQRLAEMEARAKALNAEEALQVILAESDAPIYKPYGDSLVHPAFQQPTTKREKPSTPLPSLALLEHRPTQAQDITREEIHDTSQRIEQQLRNFNVKAVVKDVLVGPVVTRYELELQPGVKASKVTNIDTDLARALMFRSIRVAEVIPGKPYIGIETPNAHRQIVPLRDVLDSNEFRDSKALLPMALGKDISGKPVVVDLAKMPHLLVAGSTGSGKSVGVNTMILSLLFRVQPEEVKFIMIDPKVVELSVYNDIPHLLTPVVTDMKKAANALRWCVDEMERRYQLLSALRVRNIEGFNEKIDEYEGMGMPIPNPIWKPGDTMDQMPPALKKLSYIVVIVDEFADLMMVAGKQIEELIARLAQKARAIGIHLILATQRPSVDVITGLIKANVPSRIAFTVASKIDSRTILDQGGAEALLGRGDMLYSGQGSSDLIRVHGAFMSDDEVVRIADDWRARGKPDYIDGILESADDEETAEKSVGNSGELDPLFDEVMEFVLTTGTTSVSALQRKFSVGFNRAARIMDQMEEQGIVSAMQNGKREILARRPDY
ncbi:cell division protein FtsK [Rodentibacter caecimuris]|uniref:DNA translocase FtsK n=1 Tax=Rodentibacter caecimuris TaxID=1796644 RepID=A0AAJ3K5P2_9PAST|nr:DNA translocase FtsK [Rodentibacter heylii]AOF52147.1 Cell division protein FtsK [Pasteurellaceae bacterium NI1060]OOF73278.1 cell division protein FtsK [Rodentibacter heylii]OOF74652.1 cell division protein FtsK [Rodentibacter heylii]OOF77997.1 cell division protein FtsK [Rodentibacter heylii]